MKVSLVSLLVVGSIAIGHPNVGSASELKNADYFAFDVSRLNGIPEDQISREGCAYVINFRSFLAALRPVAFQKSGYTPSDVRARVIVGNGQDYFIDNAGHVRQGDRRFKIDKRILDKMLFLKYKNRCR